jgi:hypothetical protein
VHAQGEGGGDDEQRRREDGDENNETPWHESSFREGFGCGGERQVF